jgi:hypothetical protein
MILNPSKQAKNLDAKFANELREKVLADPEGHGLHGSLSDGVNKERMLELAREYEEKEKNRIEVRGPRIEEREAKRLGSETNRGSGETEKRGRETDKEGMMGSIGARKKEARPRPEVLTTKWLYTARSAELQKLLRDNGRANPEGLSLKELRAMARPFIPTLRTRRNPKQPAERKKPVGAARKKRRKRRANALKLPDPANPTPPISGEIIEIKAPCFCCGRVSLLTLRDGKVWRIEIL